MELEGEVGGGGGSLGKAPHTLGARRAPSVSGFFYPKPHAVAPGGPPEGQCKKEQV